jgi:hypothetical protein
MHLTKVMFISKSKEHNSRQAITEYGADPVHVWEVIRRYPGIDLKYADKTDAEIRLYVEQEVDKRLKRYEQAGERSKGIVSLSGPLVFGTANEPRDQQIAAGVEYFTKVREHQRQIKQAIEELEHANSRK